MMLEKIAFRKSTSGFAVGIVPQKKISSEPKTNNVDKQERSFVIQ